MSHYGYKLILISNNVRMASNLLPPISACIKRYILSGRGFLGKTNNIFVPLKQDLKMYPQMYEANIVTK